MRVHLSCSPNIFFKCPNIVFFKCRFGNYKKTEYHVALLDMYQRYGPVVREKIGGKNIIHVFDPEDIKTVYSVEGRCFLHICLFYALSVKSKEISINK